MKRKASATWTGGLKTGKGTLASDSGVLTSTPYSFVTRFGDERGTNPEELIAAAHAGCFAMATSAELERAGFAPGSVDAACTITMEPVEGRPTITRSHLSATVRVPGGDADKVRAIVEGAKAGCVVSRALNVEISLEATIEV